MTAKGQPSCEWLAEELSAAIREQLHEEASQAERLAAMVLVGLAKRIGGGAYVYIRSDMVHRRSEIQAQFNGRNALEIAARHGVSVRTVYRLGKKS